MEERHRSAAGEHHQVKTDVQTFVAENEDELAVEFIRVFVDSYSAAAAETGRFAVSLSGGSTPKKLYRRLSGVDLDWGKLFFFFGDERFVPPDDADSNFRMANDAIFLQLDIAEDHIFRWRTEYDDPAAAAADYSDRLKDYFGGMPRFDLCLLGLGPDAHTASLFPHTSALRDDTHIAVANYVPEFGAARLTLTPTAINNSRTILFIATGAEKADAVHAVLQGERRPDELPAQLIEPRSGDMRWLIDHAAAAGLNH